jgi:hypothetical protein
MSAPMTNDNRPNYIPARKKLAKIAAPDDSEPAFAARTGKYALCAAQNGGDCPSLRAALAEKIEIIKGAR